MDTMGNPVLALWCMPSAPPPTGACHTFALWDHQRRFPARPGGLGYRDDNLVEYDMDAEDDKWLAALNGDQVWAAVTVANLHT